MRSAPQNKLWGADVTLPPAAPFGFPSQVCAHGRRRDRCKACQGKSFCEHGRARNRCKECGGSQICEHKRLRQYCKECGGSQICEHDRVRYQCKQCKKECIGGSKGPIPKQNGKGKGKGKAHSRSSSAKRQAASTYTAGVRQSTRGSDRPRKSYNEDSGSELNEEERECAVRLPAQSDEDVENVEGILVAAASQPRSPVGHTVGEVEVDTGASVHASSWMADGSGSTQNGDTRERQQLQYVTI